MSSNAAPHATIAIISIGQMGAGIARLLIAHNYRVITNVSDRSEATQSRARDTGVELLDSDDALVQQADYILSIVPPRDAVATAERVLAAAARAFGDSKKETDLYYLELNAISPATVKTIHATFTSRAPSIRFLDGGIIGGPPSPPSSSDQNQNATSPSPASTWTRPAVPLSGPHSLPLRHLAQVLNTNHLDPTIGSASGLKCCFAALSKGFTALALQSYTSASSLGVLPHLQSYLDTYNPGARTRAEKGIVGCTSKAGRWVEEMRQIGGCFESEGGFGADANVFGEVAGVFEGLAGVVEESHGQGMGDVESVVGRLGARLKEKRE